MQGGGNNDSKKPEKPQIKPNETNKKKEDTSKNTKPIGAFNNLKKVEKEPPKPKPNRISTFQEKNNIVNNISTIKKDDNSKPSSGNNKFSFGFGERLKQMNSLFKNQGKDMDKRRGHSMMVTHSKMGFGQGNWKNVGSNDLGIINEEPDKMKPGYDPSVNLQKKLDVIVVKKDKRKKTILAFKE
jgi:hypothetical protein